MAPVELLALLCAVVVHAKPNLIFLILDDQDSMLNALDVMPNYVSRFKVGGAQALNAFVGTPKCCPSRTSMLSGRFAHNLNDNVMGWCGDFIANARYNETFMVDIKNAGYTMALVGKIVNSMGPMCSKDPIVPAGFNVSDGDKFAAMCNEVVYYGNTFNLDGTLYTTGESGAANYLQAFIGNQTIPWLRNAAQAAASGGKPFFAYLAPHAPHFPAEPAPWYADAPLPSETAPRLPSFDGYTEGKSWAIQENAPFDDFTTKGIDLHFRNRQRSLMSVDDYVHDIFAVLEETGTLDNTFVFATSDHGYHLGEFRIPFEKSLPYETDVRPPFYVTGPGIAPGSNITGLVSLMDVGATLMELAGAVPAGTRTTDGRSIVPLLSPGNQGRWPGGVRDGGILIEHLGEVNQWMAICGWVFNATPCPPHPATKDPFYLIDGPQNTWSLLRIANETANLAYIEFRPQGSPIARSSTNWTELYDLTADPWQAQNLALNMTPSQLAPLSAALWSFANCSGTECP